MTHGKVVVLVILAAVAAWATVVLATHGESEVFCQTGSLLFDDGSGWTGGEDAANNCAFTLYDAEHSRLPPDSYEGTGFAPLPPIPRDLSRPVAFVVLVLAVAGIAVMLMSIRRPAAVHDEAGMGGTSSDDS